MSTCQPAADDRHRAALQADGKIVVAGETYAGPAAVRSDVVVMRFNADGSLDNAFHPGGPEGAGIRVIDYAYFDSARRRADPARRQDRRGG